MHLNRASSSGGALPAPAGIRASTLSAVAAGSRAGVGGAVCALAGVGADALSAVGAGACRSAGRAGAVRALAGIRTDTLSAIGAGAGGGGRMSAASSTATCGHGGRSLPLWLDAGHSGGRGNDEHGQCDDDSDSDRTGHLQLTLRMLCLM